MANVRKLIIYLIFCSTLFVGLFFGENSSGGGKIDHIFLFTFIENFSFDLKEGLNLFVNHSASLIHSPVFYIITGFFLKITNNLTLVKFLNIFVSCLLPYIFYLIIKTKHKIDTNYIFYFSLVIFLSPYFRSSAIWLLGDNLSLLFFSLSILFYFKTNDQKKNLINFYLCFLFLALCCYIRYYYFVFAFYILYNFNKNLEIKNFLKLIFFGLIISIPGFFYFFYVIKNFNFLGKLNSYGSINYYSTGLIILSILLFYLIPFIYVKKGELIEYYKNKPKNIFMFLTPILFLYLIDKFYFNNLIDISSRGGGIFVKLSEIININTELFVSVISFVSLLIIDFLFYKKRFENYFLLIILVFCFPIYTIYQKYLDPLFYIVFFGLINSTYLKKIIISHAMPLYFLYGYFLIFLLYAIFYYSIGL